MRKEVKELIEKIENLDWTVTIENENLVSIGKYSPAGQDFSITVSIGNEVSEFIENIYQRYSDFDSSYETYLWLDNQGHGTNGAPYDMKDLYEDMEICKENIHELYKELIKQKEEKES